MHKHIIHNHYGSNQEGSILINSLLLYSFHHHHQHNQHAHNLNHHGFEDDQPLLLGKLLSSDCCLVASTQTAQGSRNLHRNQEEEN